MLHVTVSMVPLAGTAMFCWEKPQKGNGDRVQSTVMFQVALVCAFGKSTTGEGPGTPVCPNMDCCVPVPGPKTVTRFPEKSTKMAGTVFRPSKTLALPRIPPGKGGGPGLPGMHP